ncbi:MAG: hypothetical protein GTN69_02420, partial [Armatimonadetes bacterium]|nr:hypothetical protein [Armatimonadota bacterium]NIO74756.1 hypothetical protein [Armatimonadota bacterium]NIO95974.1 hypothetical protein [Armatimonadota bacterium]
MGARNSARMPWDRRKGEPASAYGKFLIYRNLGPKRSLARAAEQCDVSLGRLKQLSVEWSWLARALAWDHWHFQKQRQQELADYQESHRRIRREAQDWQCIARAQISSWVCRDANGQLQLTRELSPSEALRLWRVGCHAEMQLRGAASSLEDESEAYVERLRDQKKKGMHEVAGALSSACRDCRFHNDIYRAVVEVIDAWILWLCKTDSGKPLMDLSPIWPWDLPFSA